MIEWGWGDWLLIEIIALFHVFAFSPLKHQYLTRDWISPATQERPENASEHPYIGVERGEDRGSTDDIGGTASKRSPVEGRPSSVSVYDALTDERIEEDE